MSAAIDTLTIYQRLKSANLVDKVAQEIAEVFKDVFKSNLVKKEDLKFELEKIKADLIKWVACMLVA